MTRPTRGFRTGHNGVDTAVEIVVTGGGDCSYLIPGAGCENDKGLFHWTHAEQLGSRMRKGNTGAANPGVSDKSIGDRFGRRETGKEAVRPQCDLATACATVIIKGRV